MSAISEDHDAFKVIITNVSGGSYRLIITNTNGYSYTSAIRNSADFTYTVTGAKSNVTYTVYIINVGATTVKGTVKISSFYNSYPHILS